MQVHEELLAHLHARRGRLLILEDFHQRDIAKKKKKEKKLLSQTTTGAKNRFEYSRFLRFPTSKLELSKHVFCPNLYDILFTENENSDAAVRNLEGLTTLE